jgi:hypothetical protein
MKNILVTLLFMASVSANAETSCFYPSSKDQGVDSHFEDCGSVDGDVMKLATVHQDNIKYDANQLACVIFSAEDVFYLHKEGRSRRVVFFDNGCDYFKDGLARGISGDKMVFINPQLDIVLDPGFGLLSHFDYGHSVVCNGPFSEEQHGEHTLFKGGKCGLINRQGKLVVEAKYRIENRDAFQAYINANSHCPPPPVTSRSSALCHAKRHVSNMEFHSDEWANHRITRQGDSWLITFVEKDNPNEAFTLTLNSKSAHWESIVKNP